MIDNLENDVYGYILSDTNAEYNYKTWTTNKTKTLLHCYKKYRNSVGTFQMKNMKKMWEVVAAELNEETDLNVTPSNCENRWRVLERNYKKYIDNNNKTGRARKQFEFAQEFDDIFGKKRNIYPELLLSENTTIIPVQPSNKSDYTSASMIYAPSTSTERDTETNYVMTDHADTSQNSLSTLPCNQEQVMKRRYRNIKKPVRNDILENIRRDRIRYYNKRIELQESQFERKMEIENEKLNQIRIRNELIKERNVILNKIPEHVRSLLD